MMKVIVYSKSNCPFCVQAKNLLKNKNVEFEEIMIDDDDERLAFYAKVGNGVRTMPQIFVNDERIGGFQDLVKSDFIKNINVGFDEQF